MLDSKAAWDQAALRPCSNMLEELLDDQEDIGDINLSSRPMREEGRRQRDREALEREVRRPVCLQSISNAVKATAALLAGTIVRT